MSNCTLCHDPLDRFDLAAAMYEGQVVRDTENQPWAGQPVCSRCFDIISMGDRGKNQIMRLRQEKGWRLEYALWLFNIITQVFIVAPTVNDYYYSAELEGVPGVVEVYSTKQSIFSERTWVKVRSESGVLKVI